MSHPQYTPLVPNNTPPTTPAGHGQSLRHDLPGAYVARLASHTEVLDARPSAPSEGRRHRRVHCGVVRVAR